MWYDILYYTLKKEFSRPVKYLVTVSFLDPVEGIVAIEGESLDDAREKARALFQNRQNLAIVEVKELEDEPELPFDIEITDNRKLN